MLLRRKWVSRLAQRRDSGSVCLDETKCRFSMEPAIGTWSSALSNDRCRDFVDYVLGLQLALESQCTLQTISAMY